MPLAPRNPDIPGVSKPPARCRFLVDGKEKKCGAEAHNWIESHIEVMEKQVKVKLPLCDEHKDEIGGRNASLSTDGKTA